MSAPLLRRSLVGAGLALALGAGAAAQPEFVRLAPAQCAAPPVLHCPDTACTADRVINPGPVVEMKTRRTYFLDYPCDLKPDEKVTVVLSLHGGGSYGNWQRHYFPILDFVDKYRLVVATPNSPTRVWSEADDEYLQNIVAAVTDGIGRANIRAFWLAGHSQGGLTSNRLIRTKFFQDRVDGWISLSGGRLGENPGRGNFGSILAPPARGRGRSGLPDLTAVLAALRELPAGDFSFIFETGEREMDDRGLPGTSAWAARYGCGPRRRDAQVADTKGGYVYDSTRQNPPNPAWGLLPGPGKADVYLYPDCRDGRVVADVVRLEKGHTEGLEPNVTDALIKLMVSARGGKMQQDR
jgi:hypothetical protein